MPSQTKKVTAGFGKQDKGELIELPSGAVVRARITSISALVKQGILESMDSLTGIVMSETIPKAQGKPKVDTRAIMKDPKRMAEVMLTMDKIVMAVVTEPEIYPVPIPTDEKTNEPIPHPTRQDIDALRDEDRSYIDFVSDDDKAYIMSWAMGGTKDLAQFREITKEDVGGVSARKTTRSKTK